MTHDDRALEDIWLDNEFHTPNVLMWNFKHKRSAPCLTPSFRYYFAFSSTGWCRSWKIGLTVDDIEKIHTESVPSISSPTKTIQTRSCGSSSLVPLSSTLTPSSDSGDWVLEAFLTVQNTLFYPTVSVLQGWSVDKKRKKFDVLREECLRVVFLTSVEGRRDRRVGYPPDWGQWTDSPDPLCGHASRLSSFWGGCSLWMDRARRCSRTMERGIEMCVLDGVNSRSLVGSGYESFTVVRCTGLMDGDFPMGSMPG
jgi:hypothetical protein